MGIAGDLCLMVLAALVGGLVARRLKLPLILGYIVGGVMVGPNTPGPTVSQIHDIELLADVGVSFLLFAVGLEFSLERLRAVGRVAVAGTGMQLLVTILAVAGIGRLSGLPWTQGIWLGALLSLSSTAVALTVLADRGYTQALSGRVMLGMLLVQDLAAIPMMLILPALGDPGQLAGKLGLAGLKAVAFVAITLSAGSRLLPRLMFLVASWESRELFLLTVTGIGLGIGYASHLMGLSFALGAFLAGVILSETDVSHQVLGSVTPLRDLAGCFFFVSVGLLLDPAWVWSHLALVLVVTALVLLGKGLIMAGVVRAFGYSHIIPFAAGLTLFQVGEFSFVLARAGLDSGSLQQNLYDLLLAVATLSMALTPPMASLAPWLYHLRGGQGFPLTLTEQPLSADHILIGGYGRVGQIIAEMLSAQGCRCRVVELGWRLYRQAKEDGIPCLYGDLTSEQVLECLGLERVKLVILTFHEPVALKEAIQGLRRLRPDLHILAVADDQRHLQELSSLGVYRAVQPELEAGLEIIRQSLTHMGVEKAGALVDAMRVKNYGAMLDLESSRRSLRLSGVIKRPKPGEAASP